MRTTASAGVILLAFGVLCGCGDDPPVQTAVTAPREGAGRQTSDAPRPTAGQADTAEADPQGVPLADNPLPVWQLSEADFVEIEGQHRDPFRSYARVVGVESRVHVGPQVPVLLSQYSVDDLRLMAIISGIGTPKAMLLDPTGFGTLVRRGDYLGRGEVVRGGVDGSAEFEINWRVSKIRSEDIVLTREDPSSAAGGQVTRILPLHPETSETRSSRTAP